MNFRFLVVAIVASTVLPYTGSIHAQTRTRSRPLESRPSQPISTQTAVTKDGRTVLLRSDGTWEYTSDPPSPSAQVPSAPAVAQNNVLSLEAGLVFRSGDIKPVARTTFYLLDDNLAKILREAGLQPPGRIGSSSGDPDTNMVFGFASATKYSSLPDYQAFLPAAMAALKPHILQSVTTDFSGKASFAPIASGTYYLMGVSQTPRGFAVWNLKVDINSSQSVTLDQNNAVYAG